jgi:hypothetical protein
LDQRGTKWQEAEEECIMGSSITCTLHKVSLGRSNQGGCDERGMGEVRNEYNILVGKPEGKNHLEDLGVAGKIILKWLLGK